jgi:hypothetical protein
MAACGLLDSDGHEDPTSGVHLDFTLEDLEDDLGIRVRTRLLNEGEQTVAIVAPVYCEQDYRFHETESPSSPVVWSSVEAAGCNLRLNADLILPPGGSTELPQEVPWSILAADGVSPGSHLLSYRWPVTIRRDGDDIDDVFSGIVGIVRVGG